MTEERRQHVLTVEDMEPLNHQRQNDSFLRKVMTTITAALVIQAIGWIYLLGSLVNQVDNNTKDIEKLNSVNERLIRIEVKTDTVIHKVEKLENKQ